MDVHLAVALELPRVLQDDLDVLRGGVGRADDERPRAVHSEVLGLELGAVREGEAAPDRDLGAELVSTQRGTVALGHVAHVRRGGPLAWLLGHRHRRRLGGRRSLRRRRRQLRHSCRRRLRHRCRRPDVRGHRAALLDVDVVATRGGGAGVDLAAAAEPADASSRVERDAIARGVCRAQGLALGRRLAARRGLVVQALLRAVADPNVLVLEVPVADTRRPCAAAAPSASATLARELLGHGGPRREDGQLPVLVQPLDALAAGEAGRAHARGGVQLLLARPLAPPAGAALAGELVRHHLPRLRVALGKGRLEPGDPRAARVAGPARARRGAPDRGAGICFALLAVDPNPPALQRLPPQLKEDPAAHGLGGDLLVLVRRGGRARVRRRRLALALQEHVGADLASCIVWVAFVMLARHRERCEQ
mmetsp:Transcript_125678/g.391355  ORF Transcript_125678/g.391355 Transcript_125678/m.391355 type:complete len:421 (+) Transcript_125678:1536-2798(+)